MAARGIRRDGNPLDRAPCSQSGVRYELAGDLTSPLAQNQHRQVWRATSDCFSHHAVIVEFLAEQPEGVSLRDPCPAQPRGIVVLRACGDAPAQASHRWPPAAIVTLLPASLPEPYERFKLVDFVGMGGMGQVWAAESRDYPLRLAIKFITLPEGPPSFLALGHFETEAAAGAQITHRYIVHTRQLIDLQGQIGDGWPPLGLVMEYLPVSLDRVLKDCKNANKKLPAEVAIQWARDLVDALGELHEDRGLVHRDLKPANVMIRLPEGAAYYDADSVPEALKGSRAVLGDLGVVARVDQPGVCLKQDGWKAPELFIDPPACGRSNSRYQPAVAEDIWAFGKLLCALAEQCDGDPKWLRAAAADCMNPDPTRRPATAAELLMRLSPDWDVQLRLLMESGWRPAEHRDFVGRRFVFEAFEQFRGRCAEKGQGGMFLIEGDAGVGKTALLTQWAGRGGPHPAFFFRYRDGRTRPSAMPEKLINMLAGRYGLSADLPAREDEFPARLHEILTDISATKLKPIDDLLILVDGLDEADGPTEAAKMLPKPPLPRGVFVIVSSRPPADEHDHLALLESAGAERFRLCGTDSRNIADGTEFVQQKLQGLKPPPADGQARALAECAGGIFELLRQWVEAILKGDMTVADVLNRPAGWQALPSSERLFAWYRESWDRIARSLQNRQDLELLVDFACLMAAVVSPVTESQILAILKWPGARLDWAMTRLAWLLSRRVEEVNGHREGCLQLRHQSIHEFLVSQEHRGPARHDLPGMHQRIGEHYLAEAKSKGWTRVDPYGRFFAVWHLVQSNDRDCVAKALDCLRDLTYLQATLGEET